MADVQTTHTSTRRDWTAAKTALSQPLGEFTAVAVVLAAGLVLWALAVTGAEPVPMLAALGVFAGAAGLAGRGLYLRYPHAHLGWCNVVTLARLAMVAALIVPVAAGAAPSWAVFGLALVALSLDGIDGWLARRQGAVSRFGARFDMEVDSLLALTLALMAAVAAGLGAWVILLGLPRYAFAVAAWALPWMRRDLPERFSRKAVCVIQIAVLIALQVPVMPMSLAVGLAGFAALALGWSFAVDLMWLWRRRP